MNVVRFAGFCLVLLLLAACMEEVAAVPTVAITAVSPTQPPLQPAHTKTPAKTPSPTTTPALSSPIPHPTSIPPTPVPSPTKIADLPQEQLLFLWDAKPLPQKDDLSSGTPIQNLYLGTFTGASMIFGYERLLTDLVGWPELSLSPDKTKFVLGVIEDTNLDGHLSDSSHDQGFDFKHLFLYEFSMNQLKRLTEDTTSNQHLTQWLPDGQTIIYQASNDDSVIVMDTSSTNVLRNFVLDTLNRFSIASNGELILVNLSDQIVFLDADTGEKLFITNEIYGPTAVWSWSPDSKWVALLDHRRQLYLINAETLTIQWWETAVSVHEAQWLPSENILTIIQETHGTFSIAYLNPETLDTQPLFNGNETIRYLLWSPDGSQLAFSEEQNGLFNLQLHSRTENVTKSLWQIGDVDALFPLEWSQDQEWLLLQTWDDAEIRSNVYIASSQQEVVYPIFETTATSAPYSWHWISVD